MFHHFSSTNVLLTVDYFSVSVAGSTTINSSVSPAVSTDPNPSVTSTLYHRFLLQSTDITISEDIINEADPALEEKIYDNALDFELAQDFSTDPKDKAERTRNFNQYLSEKEDLVGKLVELPNKRDKNHPVKWKVRKDICRPIESEADNDNEKNCGVKYFDFNKQTCNSRSGNKPRLDTSHLLLHLWPGDFKSQVDNMNCQILTDNNERIQKGRSKVPLVSYQEMGVFLGIFLIARLEGKKGSNLWVGDPLDGEGYRSQVDVSSIMSESRHRQLRNYFEIFFADHLKKGEDAWWKVLGGVDGFNNNRRKVIASSKDKTPDETISSYRPRTTATGMYLSSLVFLCIIYVHHTDFLMHLIVVYIFSQRISNDANYHLNPIRSQN